MSTSFETLRAVMKGDAPRHPPFYKFMTDGVAEIVLQNRTLRWSTPGTFNDPFDTQFDLFLPDADKALKAQALRLHWDSMFNWGPVDVDNPLGAQIAKMRPYLTRRLTFEEFAADFGPVHDEMIAGGPALLAQLHLDFREFFKTTKILCLTTRLESVQMWSHYAGDHRGVALEFRSVPFLGSPWSEAKPVQYLTSLPLLIGRERFAEFMAGRATIDKAGALDATVYSKAKEWENEREWRISSGNGRDRDAPFEDIPFNELELASVFVGCRMATERAKTIRDLARDRFPHVRIFMARQALREFQLEFHEI